MAIDCPKMAQAENSPNFNEFQSVRVRTAAERRWALGHDAVRAEPPGAVYSSMSVNSKFRPFIIRS